MGRRRVIAASMPLFDRLLTHADPTTGLWGNSATNLTGREIELVPLGAAKLAAPLLRNAARPSRFALEVQSLPAAGWLVEVDAVYPPGATPR